MKKKIEQRAKEQKEYYGYHKCYECTRKTPCGSIFNCAWYMD